MCETRLPTATHPLILLLEYPLTYLPTEVVSTVAYGGNALINVGPTADGRIAVIFQVPPYCDTRYTPYRV